VTTGHEDASSPSIFWRRTIFTAGRERLCSASPIARLSATFGMSGSLLLDIAFHASWRGRSLLGECRALFGDEREDTGRTSAPLLNARLRRGPDAYTPTRRRTRVKTGPVTWAQYLHIIDGARRAAPSAGQATMCRFPSHHSRCGSSRSSGCRCGFSRDAQRLGEARSRLNEIRCSSGHATLYPIRLLTFGCSENRGRSQDDRHRGGGADEPAASTPPTVPARAAAAA